MFELPANVAVTVVDPSGNDEIESEALPWTICAVPNTIFPAVKVTGPVGFTVGDVTFAVKVTACPNAEGFGDDVRVVALVA